MDFQIQVDNLGSSTEKAEFTLRNNGGQMIHIPIKIQSFDYINEGRTRSVSATLSPMFSLTAHALEGAPAEAEGSRGRLLAMRDELMRASPSTIDEALRGKLLTMLHEVIIDG